MKLELEFDAEEMPIGGELPGRLRVVEGGDAESLTLNVVMYEKSPSYEVAANGASAVLPTESLGDGDVIDFTVRLPDGAVPSTKTKHGELYWEVEVVAEKGGLNARARRRLTVL